jgi:hypothetical protein
MRLVLPIFLTARCLAVLELPSEVCQMIWYSLLIEGVVIFCCFVFIGAFVHCVCHSKYKRVINQVYCKVGPRWGCEPFRARFALCMTCIALDS